jgi:hypothetical protein
MNEFPKQLRKMPGALLPAEWHTGQFILGVDSVEPIFDRRLGVAFQY